MSFQSWLPSEHRRRTQHIFKALSNNVKSIILRPPFSLPLIRVDFLIFGFLYFHTKSKISLLTSVANVSGVFSTLHTNANFAIAIVFTILILPNIDISLEDQMFNVLLNGSSRSKKFFLAARWSSYEK